MTHPPSQFHDSSMTVTVARQSCEVRGSALDTITGMAPCDATCLFIGD